MADLKQRKRSKVYYAPKRATKRAREVCAGMRGVLVTTNGRERQCVAEAYDLFNEYADILYGPEFDDKKSESSTEKEEVELEEEFASEVKKLKGEEGSERRFQAANSGAKNVIFIGCRAPVEPCDLVHAVLVDVKKSGVSKARFCQRLTPVSVVCRATLQDITKHATPLLQPHFHATIDPDPVQFSVHYKSRNNDTLKRDQVIKLLASLVTDEGAYPHTVCLDNPQLVVCVNIIRGLCCLSVVKDFAELKQYNIQALCEQNSDKTEPSPARTDVPHTASSDKGESESQKADEVSVAEGEMMVDSTEQ